MKTIGLLGGMSWESTLEYYRLINEDVKQRLGGFHSAKCLLYSVDFADIEVLQEQGAWDEAGEILASTAQSLERGGADCLVLCTNTMHKCADQIQARIGIPMLHMVDVVARAISQQGLGCVGLLGTHYTMEQPFYKGRLTERHGIEVLIPDAEERDTVHRVIDEICLGRVGAESRGQYIAIMERLADAGAQGVILGCTEIGLLVHDGDCRVPLFDTTQIHAAAAVDFALQG